MKYRVAHEVARAVNFREATFSGMLDAPQQDGKMAWLVTFTLAEHVSVQEKREARATGKTTAKNRRPAVRDNPVARVPERMKKTDMV